MRRAAAIAAVSVALVAPVAALAQAPVLTGHEARVAIHNVDSRNTVKRCKRLSMTHIRCLVRMVGASVQEEETGTDVTDIYLVLVADVWPNRPVQWAFPGFAD